MLKTTIFPKFFNKSCTLDFISELPNMKMTPSIFNVIITLERLRVTEWYTEWILEITESSRNVQIHSHPISWLFQCEPSIHLIIESPYYFLKELSGFKMILWWLQKRLCSTSQNIMCFSLTLLCTLCQVKIFKSCRIFFQSSIIRCQSGGYVCVRGTRVLIPGVMKTLAATGVEMDISETREIAGIENDSGYVPCLIYLNFPGPAMMPWYIVITKGVDICYTNYRSIDNMNICWSGGSVEMNLLANAGNVVSIPGPGRSHMPGNNQSHAPQLLRLHSRVREPTCHSYCSLYALELVLGKRRSYRSEQPMHHN